MRYLIWRKYLIAPQIEDSITTVWGSSGQDLFSEKILKLKKTGT